MARRKVSETEPLSLSPNPGATAEARENELIALAYSLAEQRLRNGTATSQEVVHFLKMGSIRQQTELEKLKKENELLVAKTEAIHASTANEDLYREAIAAMKSYQPSSDDGEDIYDDPYLY